MLVVSALALGTAGCGNDAKAKQEAAATARAVAVWRAGISRWHDDMLAALNGISLLLSAERPVELLEASDPATDAKLDGFERPLEHCSARIRRLGAAPPGLAEARRSALGACAGLEAGAGLVETAVEDLRRGLGYAGFDRITGPLSAGQNEADVAAREARRPPSP